MDSLTHRLRFKAITCIPADEVNIMLRDIPSRNIGLTQMISPQFIESVTHHTVINTHIDVKQTTQPQTFSPPKVIQQSRASRHQQQSMIRKFVNPVAQDKLREEYAILWFEKLALESSAERLQQEARKKDAMIVQLSQELQGMKTRRIV